MADYGLLALQEQGQMDRDRAGEKGKSEKKKRKKRSKWISGLGAVGGIAGGLAMNALIPGSGLGLMMASMATGAAAGAGTALGQGIGRGVSKQKGWGADRNLGQGRSVFGGSISAQQNVSDAFYGDQDAYNQMEKAGYQSNIINNMMTGAFMQYKGGEQGLKAGNTWVNQLKGAGGKLKAKAGGLADMLPQRPQSEWEIASQQIKDQSLESAYGPRGQLGYGSYAQYGARPEFGKGNAWDNVQRELFQGGLDPNTGGTRPMTWTPRAQNPENYMAPQFGRSTVGSLAGDTGWIEEYPGLSLNPQLDEPLNLRMSSRLGNRVNTGGSGYGFYTGGPLDQLMGMQRNRPLNMWSQ